MEHLFAGRAALSIALLTAALVAGCKKANEYVAPPPPEVGVAHPLKRPVTFYLNQTGNTVALDTVDLVARVEGFLRQIDYTDGTAVKNGATLFVIERTPYEAKVEQAEASVAAAQAAVTQADAEYNRRAALGKNQFAAQAKVDETRRARDEARAKLENEQAALELAKINLGYTKVTAPFDGIVTAHLVAVGALVGSGQPTKLATIVRLNPIYVTFNVSEQDVLRIAADLKKRGIKVEDLGKIPIEVGLMTESGHPHKGFIDYIAPEVDPATGTLQLRAVLDNPSDELLPGFFARVRIPMKSPGDVLLVPDAALGSDQAGRYLLLADKNNVVEQRKVAVGPAIDGGMRVIDGGLSPDDRVIVTGLLRAIPGQKIKPEPIALPMRQASAAR